MGFCTANSGHSGCSDQISLGKVITRSSNDIFQRKVDVLKRRIWWVATASAAGALVPIPGLSVSVDAALILGELSFYRSQLGLPEEGFAEFLKLHLTTREEVLKVSITTVAQLSLFLVSYAAESAIEEATRFIPFVGLVVASTMSFGTTYRALHRLLEAVKDVALSVISEAADRAAAELESEID